MTFKSHLVVAAAAFAVAVRFQGALPIPAVTDYLGFLIALSMVLLGASLPDVDYPDSTVGQRVKWLSWPIYMVFGHRGITHSGLSLIGWTVLYSVTGSTLIFWLAFGWFGHLIGDFLTDSGLPLMYPSKKRYKFILTTSTSGFGEPVMVVLVVATAAATWLY